MAFFHFPHVIDTPGQYRTRKGDIVTIEKVETGICGFSSGFYDTKIRERWHNSGRIYSGCESLNDIVSKV
jgi:hypothetical protein